VVRQSRSRSYSGRVPTFDIAARLAKAREAAAEADIDAMLITPGPNLRYLTGYDALSLERLTCLVLPADRDPVLIVPTLERAAALATPVGTSGLSVLDWAETDDPIAVVAAFLGDVKRVALDDRMWAEKVLRFRAALPDTEQVAAGAALAELRIRKDPDEVAALRAAGAAIDRVHARMAEWLRPGRTEREIGRDIADAIVAEGHDRVDFVIVASGPNGASPHHAVSDRVVQRQEPIVVDIGGTMPSGYCSDETRMYVCGDAPDDFVAHYEVLYEAQATACATVRPGVAAESVDAAARSVIAAAGYGDRFIHRTGHGIGLETHEAPYIVEGNTRPLEPGFAFSVEPGIYLDGRHGARIEDIVIVTTDGVERLNDRPRELAILEYANS
jgi:Xaa-Pro aminopeptidase